MKKMKKIVIILTVFISLYVNANDLQILNNLKADILKKISDSSSEEEFNYAKFKDFTLSKDKRGNIVIDVKVSNDKQHTKFGKRILLKDIATPLSYLFFQEKTNCIAAEKTDLREKGRCHNLASSYVYDKYLIFKLDNFSIKGKNMRKDFYVNANDMEKIKRLKRTKTNWFLK